MSAEIRKRLFAEQRGKCIWCLRDCVLVNGITKRKKFPPNAMTIEHIVPRYRNPSDMNGNIAGACNECNWQRSCVESLIVEKKDFIGRIRGLKRYQFEHLLPVDICGPRMNSGNFLSATIDAPEMRNSFTGLTLPPSKPDLSAILELQADSFRKS